MSAHKDLMDALANSDLGRQALAELEAKRLVERAEILSELSTRVEVLSKQQQDSRAKARTLEVAAQEAQAVYLAAVAKLQEAEREALSASLAQDRALGRARHALAPLGMGCIEETRRALWEEQHQLRNSIGFAPAFDEGGRPAGVRPRNAEAGTRLETVQQHLASLAAMELADLAPCEIEDRCAAMLIGAKLQPRRTLRGAKAIVYASGRVARV